MSQKTDKGARFKQAFAQSAYITTGWNRFMVLAGKAAEPVPIVRFPGQLDVVVFIAQFNGYPGVATQ